MARRTSLRLAIAGWENGRAQTGFGVKVGGLAAVMEELPEELIAAADRLGINLQIELLTPCFAHYDRSQLELLEARVPAILDGSRIDFKVYRLEVSKNLSMVYFWDDWQLHWTTARAVYPDDPEVGFKLFASVSQAMAGYIRQNRFHTVHSHDYHVGLIPFYLGDDYLNQVPHHFTIHNASYQGIYPVYGKGFETLNRINLPGEKLFHKYFDFFDNLNFMKGAVIKTHETGGKVTTVSGDLEGTWGYAAELKQDHATVLERARRLSPSGRVGEVFVPNRHLDIFEHIPIHGITNGLAEKNRPENLVELKASWLKRYRSKLAGGVPVFRQPKVEEGMLSKDHNFSVHELETKAQLKRYLHLETFGKEPDSGLILITAVGRLVEQKHLGLVADIADRTLAYDPGVKFVILASAPNGDSQGKRSEERFRLLAARNPDRFFYDSEFNSPLSRLILSGGDFTLIPSQFEPCGLVDYEASLLGNVVIAHRTGGLAKIEHCGYLYDWLDKADEAGEANAFFEQARRAIDTYRGDPSRHSEMVLRAMEIDAGWASSAEQYIRLYRYGLLFREWNKKRETLLTVADRYAGTLLKKEELFGRLFSPVHQDVIDFRLEKAFRKDGPGGSPGRSEE